MNERPTRPSDDEFDDALRARRRLLPPLDLHADAEPSPELDRLVLSRAREALQLERAPERHFRGPRWAVPVAVAATVVLSFGIVMQLDPARNDAVLATGGDTATTREAVTPEAAASSEASPSTAMLPIEAPQQAAGAARDSAPVSATAAAPTAAPAPAAPPAPAAADAPAPTPAPPPPIERRAARAEAFVADAPPASAAEAMASSATTVEAAEARPAAAAGTAPASPPPPAAAVAAAADAAATGVAATAPTSIPRDDPQRWLAAIEQLQRRGEIEAARTELAAFRRRHPDQALPEPLERLLR